MIIRGEYSILLYRTITKGEEKRMGKSQVFCLEYIHGNAGGNTLLREVNPYKKVATFASLFCVHSSIKVSITFFVFTTNILLNKVKQVCYKIIFTHSIFMIYYDFLKIFNIVGNLKKKCGHHEKSWRKAATFLTGLPLT